MRRTLRSLLFLVAVFTSSAAPAQAFDPHASILREMPLVERLYVIKRSENLLGEKFKKVLDDPLNAEDGYLWGRKVIALSYALLWKLSEKSEAYDISLFYRRTAELWARNIRGELSMDGIIANERFIDNEKRAYLERMLSDARPSARSDVDGLNQLADDITSMVYGTAVIRSSGD